MPRKFVRERTVFKILVEPQGAILGITMRKWCYLVIVTKGFVGLRRCLTADRVVAAAGYSAPGTVRLIAERYPSLAEGRDRAAG